jgi:hypothetical protein
MELKQTDPKHGSRTNHATNSDLNHHITSVHELMEEDEAFGIVDEKEGNQQKQFNCDAETDVARIQQEETVQGISGKV